MTTNLMIVSNFAKKLILYRLSSTLPKTCAATMNISMRPRSTGAYFGREMSQLFKIWIGTRMTFLLLSSSSMDLTAMMSFWLKKVRKNFKSYPH